mmetsp:Transcript_14375/g.33088  ORF Transcript_14375/g.33088 Transcript_14375/m.33088 type:complete len:203 (-) Transcript_14375:3112-3720(-)
MTAAALGDEGGEDSAGHVEDALAVEVYLGRPGGEVDARQVLVAHHACTVHQPPDGRRELPRDGGNSRADGRGVGHVDLEGERAASCAVNLLFELLQPLLPPSNERDVGAMQRQGLADLPPYAPARSRHHHHPGLERARADDADGSDVGEEFPLLLQLGEEGGHELRRHLRILLREPELAPRLVAAVQTEQPGADVGSVVLVV